MEHESPVTCEMCDKEIYFSPDYTQWLHLTNGNHWCHTHYDAFRPEAMASIATPPANTLRGFR